MVEAISRTRPVSVTASQRLKKVVTTPLKASSEASSCRSCAVETNISRATMKTLASATTVPVSAPRKAFASSERPHTRSASRSTSQPPAMVAAPATAR